MHRSLSSKIVVLRCRIVAPAEAISLQPGKGCERYLALVKEHYSAPAGGIVLLSDEASTTTRNVTKPQHST